MTATASPHTLRIRVTMCPTGLKQWSEPYPGTVQGQGSGLATPYIVKRGRSAPQIEYKGRRRHFQESVPAHLASTIHLLLTCNAWVARPISVG